MFGIFFILFRSWVQVFFCFGKSKQNKKNPEHLFVDLGKQEMCTKFTKKKIKVLFGARQSFQFFKQSTWFLENNRVSCNVCYFKELATSQNLFLTFRISVYHFL